MCARPVAAVGASLLPALRIRAALLAACKARVAPPAAPLASGGGGTLRQRRAMAAATGTRPADAAAASTASEGSDIDPRAAQLLQALAIPPPPDYQLFKGSWVEHVLAPREGLLSEIVTEALRLPQVRPQYSAAASHCPLRAVGQAQIEVLGFLTTQLLRTWGVRAGCSGPQCSSTVHWLGFIQLLVLLRLAVRVRSSCCCNLGRCTPARCPLLCRRQCWRPCLQRRWRRRAHGGRQHSRQQATA